VGAKNFPGSGLIAAARVFIRGFRRGFLGDISHEYSLYQLYKYLQERLNNGGENALYDIHGEFARGSVTWGKIYLTLSRVYGEPCAVAGPEVANEFRKLSDGCPLGLGVEMSVISRQGFVVLGALAGLLHSSLAWSGNVDPFAPLETRGTAAVESTVPIAGKKVILSGATVMTASGTVFSPGYVSVDSGRIIGVGPGEPKATEDAVRIDVTGRFITPGLIDTHSHLGVYPSPSAHAHGDGNEATAPTTPGVWSEHSVWPQDPGFERAMAGGVTAMQILPGSANLIGGRGFVIQNTPHRGPRAMRFPQAPETIKMACGENPKRVYGDKGGPSTRMGNIHGQRSAFIRATRYMEEWQRWEQRVQKKREHYERELARGKKRGHEPEPLEMSPARDLDMETLAGVLQGKILPQIHCYRADDMLSMMQIAEEFGFTIRSFHHALESYKIRDILAEKKIASSTWADWWGFKMEAYDGIPYNAGMLTDAGAKAIIHSDSSVGIQRLNQEAAKALQAAEEAGFTVSEDQALQWITLHPAWALGIEDQVGSIEEGKRADLVVWDKHPFSVYASAELVFVEGDLHYDKSRSRTWSDFELGLEVGR
jgi:imidazolonepropionase-like amidohydrolase